MTAPIEPVACACGTTAPRWAWLVRACERTHPRAAELVLACVDCPDCGATVVVRGRARAGAADDAVLRAAGMEPRGDGTVFDPDAGYCVPYAIALHHARKDLAADAPTLPRLTPPRAVRS